MAEIEVSNPVENGRCHRQRWERRLKRKIEAASDGDVLIVRSGLQKAIAVAVLTRMDKKIEVVKR